MQAPSKQPIPSGTRRDSAPALRKIALRLAARMVVAALTLPVAVVMAFALHPLWSWLERTTGIESMGREGPAAWCYLLVWALLALAVMLPALWRAWKDANTPAGPGP